MERNGERYDGFKLLGGDEGNEFSRMKRCSNIVVVQYGKNKIRSMRTQVTKTTRTSLGSLGCSLVIT